MTSPTTPAGEACEVPFIEQLRSVPKGCRLTIPIQWSEDGRETGHQFIPVGFMFHRAADELERLARSESGRNIIVPPEVIEAAEWYAGVPARVGKMSDFILKLAKDKA